MFLAFQNGKTPLHEVATRGHTAAAEVLLNRGASVDAVTKVGLRAAVLPDAASMPRGADAGRRPEEPARAPTWFIRLRRHGPDCEMGEMWATSTCAPRPRFTSAILPVARAGPQYITFTGHLASSGEQRDDMSRAMGKRAMAQLANDWENWRG